MTTQLGRGETEGREAIASLFSSRCLPEAVFFELRHEGLLKLSPKGNTLSLNPEEIERVKETFDKNGKILKKAEEVSRWIVQEIGMDFFDEIEAGMLMRSSERRGGLTFRPRVNPSKIIMVAICLNYSDTLDMIFYTIRAEILEMFFGVSVDFIRSKLKEKVGRGLYGNTNADERRT